MNIHWTKRHSEPSNSQATFSAGIYHLAKNVLIAALANNDFGDGTMIFFKSTDDGSTWQQTSTLPYPINERGPRLLHYPNGNIIFGYSDPADDTVKIALSTNDTESWTTVANYPRSTTSPRAFPDVESGRTFALGSGVLGGLFTEQTLPAGVNFIFTDDSGATWTSGTREFSGTSSSLCYAIGAAPGGNLIAGGNGRKVIASTDAGATWTEVADSPLAGPGSNIFPRDFALLTSETIILAAQGLATADAGATFVYYSTDGGQTYTMVPQSDILGWPTTGQNPAAKMTSRVTRELAILGLAVTQIGSLGPIRYSTDGGQTWPGNGTGWSYQDENAIQAGGHATTARDGKICVAVDYYSNAANEAAAEIWTGEVNC